MRHTLLVVLIIGSFGTLGWAQSASGTAPATAGTSTTQTDANVQPKKKAKHVYTSDDMKAANPNDVPSATTSSSGGVAGGTKAVDDPKNDKAAKQKTAKKVDPGAVAAQQAKVDELKKQVNGLTSVVGDIQRLINEKPSRAEGMGAGLAQQQKDLTQAQKQLADAQSELDGMKNPK